MAKRVRTRKHGSYGQRKAPIRYATRKGRVHPISGRRPVKGIFNRRRRYG